MNYLVESKNEYTTQLVNILAPHIYEGLLSVYNEVKNTPTAEKKELRVFQECLSEIHKWNNDLINKETSRILQKSKCTWLEDLLKAVIKANIILLTNTSPNYSFKYLDDKMYKNIRFNNFIHKVYIECARAVFNNPYLFYHKHKPYQIKQNQRDTHILIKECIREAVRKMLPVKNILDEYLNREYKNDFKEDYPTTGSELKNSHIDDLINRDIVHKNDITSAASKLQSFKDSQATNPSTNGSDMGRMNSDRMNSDRPDRAPAGRPSSGRPSSGRPSSGRPSSHKPIKTESHKRSIFSNRPQSTTERLNNPTESGQINGKDLLKNGSQPTPPGGPPDRPSGRPSGRPPTKSIPSGKAPPKKVYEDIYSNDNSNKIPNLAESTSKSTIFVANEEPVQEGSLRGGNNGRSKEKLEYFKKYLDD
jgi:hypothetical protein